MNEQVLYNSDNNTISLRLRDHGLDVVPSSCSLDIYDRYGTALLSDQAITPDGDGVCTYTLSTNITEDLAQHNRAMWTVVVSGKTYTYNTLFDVVLTVLSSLINDEDLLNENSKLNEFRYALSGTADSGTTAYLVDDDLMGYAENFFKGGIVQFIDGTNSGNSRIVSAYDRESGKITWSTVLSSAIDTTTVYLLRRTFQPEINAAWEEILEYIDDLGFRPSLIVSNDKLKISHKYLALSKVCRSLAQEANDIWMIMADEYEKKYHSKIAGIQFQQDTDEDNSIDTESHIITGFRR